MRLALSIAVLFFLSLATFTGCSNRKAQPVNGGMTKCLNDLNSIPEMSALLKARKHAADEPDDENRGRPFEGLEIALTINGMVMSEADPEADVDDLCYTENTSENVGKILNALETNAMPPTVSFVLGSSFDERMQTRWLQSGNLIGSLGYDRLPGTKATAEDVVKDLSRNDGLLATLWRDHPPAKKYFRYSSKKLRRSGRDMRPVASYLKDNRYVVVPATLDLLDGALSQFYCAAVSRGDHSCVSLIKANFYSLALDTTLKARAIATSAAGHDVKQILVVRADQFICDILPELLTWYRSLGARFIKLDDALADPFYAGDRAYEVIGETRNAQASAAEKR